MNVNFLRPHFLGLCVGVLFASFQAFTHTEAADSQATPASAFRVPEGFQVELLYEVPADTQGSWVNLTVDPKGRLITSDQNGGLYRVEITADGSAEPVSVTSLQTANLGAAQGLLCIEDKLYLMTNAYGPGGKKYTSGLYLLRDTDGDDQYDEVKTLVEFKGGGEHGPHAVIPGPDGKIYFCAGNHTDVPESIVAGVVPQVWQEDHLLGRMPDARGHAATRMAPGGWIARMNPDGSQMELVSTGYRNQFDIAFNPSGELFTYDADMEWDVNAPWYRPTRVNHATSGSEFGWRNGTGKWPADYPDSLGSVVDIGPGSPTGICFGTGAKFPAKYQRALYLCDWSYGNLFAAQLTPDGSSYTGVTEVFATAAPFPVTDVIIRPQDGAMYITMGGRGTQSALYRIRYTGKESTAPADVVDTAEAKELRATRHAIEAFHGKSSTEAVTKSVPLLGHADRALRSAARVALEHQPVANWRDAAVKHPTPLGRITACVALARTGKAEDQAVAVSTLQAIDWDSLSPSERVDLLRAYALVFLRLGKPNESQRAAILEQLDKRYPSTDMRANRDLAMVLIYLDAPHVVARSVRLQTTAPTQEDQMHFAFCLREHTTGWTDEDRKAYFGWFRQMASARGGMSFGGFLENIRKVAIDKLSEEQKQSLGELLTDVPKEAVAQMPPRPFVRKWTVDEAMAAIEKTDHKADVARGQALFAEVACFKCHRMAGQGGILGPDLTGAGGRFSSRDLLASLIQPSAVISDQYGATQFLTADGKVVVGKIVNMSGSDVKVMTNMLDPSDQTNIKRDQIEEMFPAKTSMMPEGLVDSLTAEDLVDLMAYLRSGGRPLAKN